MNLQALAFIATLALAGLVRLYRLGEIPNGFSPDEASYGYNGYSLLLTGKDRFGHAFPLFADNFGDLIATSYMWLTVPAIALFGLNEFAVRLPAALVGIATVFVIYKLGEIFVNRWVGLLAALLLTLSPWHIQVSRYAERSPLLLLCFCLGLLLFLRWQARGGPKLWWSALCFGLCFYTYASARVFVPIFIGSLLVVYHRPLRDAGREAVWALGILVLLGLLALPHWFSAAGMARAELLLEFAPSTWLANYLSYFSPDHLFFNGDSEIRHSLADMGQLHLFELALVPLGAFFLLRRRRPEDVLMGLWLVFYPIPAAFTAPTHAIRSVIGAPLFALLSACGIYQLVLFFGERTRWLLGAGCGGLLLWTALSYGQRYFFEYSACSAVSWNYGMREAFNYAESGSHQRVYISNRFFLPHIFALFYTAYPPDQYQRAPLRVAQGHWRYSRFTCGRYQIAPLAQIDAASPGCQNELLVVLAGAAREMAERTRYELVHTVAVPDGRALIEIYECQ